MQLKKQKKRFIRLKRRTKLTLVF